MLFRSVSSGGGDPSQFSSCSGLGAGLAWLVVAWLGLAWLGLGRPVEPWRGNQAGRPYLRWGVPCVHQGGFIETGARSLGEACGAQPGRQQASSGGFRGGMFIAHKGGNPAPKRSGDPFRFAQDHVGVVGQSVRPYHCRLLGST